MCTTFNGQSNFRLIYDEIRLGFFTLGALKYEGLNGEPAGIRTLDLLIKSQLLYQLSYRLPLPRVLGARLHGVKPKYETELKRSIICQLNIRNAVI